MQVSKQILPPRDLNPNPNSGFLAFAIPSMPKPLASIGEVLSFRKFDCFCRLELMKTIILIVLFSQVLSSGVRASEEIMGSPVLWMDAASGVEAPAEGVTAWQSRIGTFRAVIPEGGTAPKLVSGGIAGKPAVEFGEKGYLTGPIGQELGKESSFVAVVNIPSGGNRKTRGVFALNYIFGLAVDSSQPALQMSIYFPELEKKYGPEKATVARGGMILSTASGFDAPAIVSLIYGAEKSSMYVNGKPVGEVSLGAFIEQKPSTNVGLGAYGGPNHQAMTGQIAEALLYNEALSPEKRAGIEKALAEKYGIALLP